MIDGLNGKYDMLIISDIRNNGPSTVRDIAVRIGTIKKCRRGKYFQYSTGVMYRIMQRLELIGAVKRVGNDIEKPRNPTLWGLSSNIECGKCEQYKDERRSGQNCKPCYKNKNGVTVHVFEHGAYVCQCGDKTCEPYKRQKYGDFR